MSAFIFLWGYLIYTEESYDLSVIFRHNSFRQYTHTNTYIYTCIIQSSIIKTETANNFYRQIPNSSNFQEYESSLTLTSQCSFDFPTKKWIVRIQKSYIWWMIRITIKEAHYKNFWGRSYTFVEYSLSLLYVYLSY